MEERLFIIALIIFVLLLIAALDFRGRLKLKKQIQKNWGKQPRQPRFDKEKSLKEAWLTEKKFFDWDSEIDDITWNDLDMFELFETLNSTYSSVGSEALYQQLRNFNFDEDKQLTELIAFFDNNAASRQKIQYYFAQLGKQDHNFSKKYLAEEKQQQLGQLSFFVMLGLLPILGVLLLLFGQMIGIWVSLGSILFNTIYYSIKKNNLDTELNSMRYLVQTIASGNKIAKENSPVQNELKDYLKPLKSIPRFGVSFRSKSGSEADMFFDYINIMFMLPFISYHYVVTHLQHHHQEAIHLWELLGKLEVACAILNFRTYMPLTCIPTFSDNCEVLSEDSYHPLLNEAVVNDINWKENTLVTGSNASGKSTYVKSVAINCILAQTIQTAVAETFTMTRGHVLTSMAVADNLFEGDSYFVAEIKSIKRLLNKVASKEPCYYFIDEILKGTNTIERISASVSVFRWLADYPCLAFVATHDVELPEILKNFCKNIHFSEQVTKDKGISFDYKLRQGPAQGRNAIALLQVLDYPAEIVATAKNEASYFDQYRKWQVFPKE